MSVNRNGSGAHIFFFFCDDDETISYGNKETNGIERRDRKQVLWLDLRLMTSRGGY